MFEDIKYGDLGTDLHIYGMFQNQNELNEAYKHLESFKGKPEIYNKVQGQIKDYLHESLGRGLVNKVDTSNRFSYSFIDPKQEGIIKLNDSTGRIRINNLKDGGYSIYGKEFDGDTGKETGKIWRTNYHEDGTEKFFEVKESFPAELGKEVPDDVVRHYFPQQGNNQTTGQQTTQSQQSIPNTNNMATENTSSNNQTSEQKTSPSTEEPKVSPNTSEQNTAKPGFKEKTKDGLNRVRDKFRGLFNRDEIAPIESVAPIEEIKPRESIVNFYEGMDKDVREFENQYQKDVEAFNKDQADTKKAYEKTKKEFADGYNGTNFEEDKKNAPYEKAYQERVKEFETRETELKSRWDDKQIEFANRENAYIDKELKVDDEFKKLQDFRSKFENADSIEARSRLIDENKGVYEQIKDVKTDEELRNVARENRLATEEGKKLRAEVEAYQKGYTPMVKKGAATYTGESLVEKVGGKIPGGGGGKWGKIGSMAVGALMTAGLVSTLSANRGQQTNAQLYGQQPLY